MLTGITRVRNESLIVADTINHFLGYCDQIILYDDCSTDQTADIAKAAGGDRIEIIHGDEWLLDRPAEETRHRGLLLDRARELGADWCLCFDADERLVGELPDLTAGGYRFRLFDGYLTPEFSTPYSAGPLTDLSRAWGPEFRDILMLFRTDKAVYKGLDRREPILNGKAELADMYVKHFGKCLSIEHWESTCSYYADHWPEPYKSKWKARKGKAVHDQSDFGRPLYRWPDLMANRQSWARL